MVRLINLLSVVAALVGAVAAADATNPHKITSLPNYNDPKPINFDQYAGNIALPSNGQKMFYWLVESEANPSTDPLVLWLNGGPGCSSLGGFFTELGPFVVESDLSVKRNPYAWNRKANVVFLESPSGVGFSQPVLDDKNYNDEFTMDRVYEFLVQFYAKYPAYAHREFYVTGESYAGIYIPYLAYKLVEKPIPAVNFTGYAIGNPYTDAVVDGNSNIDYYYHHGLISIESYNTVKASCPTGLTGNVTAACQTAQDDAETSASTDALNPYYIYGDVCLLQNDQAKTLPNYNIRPNTHRGEIGPCTDKFTETYLRLEAVQKAIHVENGGSIQWTDCADLKYHSSPSSLQKYPKILQAGLKALIYSGDADTVVNFIGTQRWLTTEGLKLKVQDKWKAWFGPDKQLAGYTETYTNITFTTIKGAGHMVPATRPLHGLYLFECFIYGQAACEKFSYPKDALEYLSGADLTAPVTAAQGTVAYLWWALGGVVLVVVALVAWRVVATQKAKKEAVKYTELTSEVKPVYTK